MPGPLPAFRPVFPAEFLELARRTAVRRTIGFQLRQRAELVLLLHEQPRLRNAEAGERVGLHPDSVRHWRRRWARGEFRLDDRPGRGRKPGFSPPGPSRHQGHRL